MCTECESAASFSSATADRGPAGCKDTGQWHTGRSAQGKRCSKGAREAKVPQTAVLAASACR